MRPHRPGRGAPISSRGSTREQGGRLDVLVNNLWGGDPLTDWDVPFWEHDLADGLQIQRQAVWAHAITAHAAVPLMVARGAGLVVEVTDGVTDHYRGSLFYDLAKASAIRLATAMDAELRPRGVTAVAVSPGFLRSEAVLDHFGVTAATWRDGIAKDEHFAQSETPRFVGRAVAALAADPERARWAGRALGSWDLARDYGFADVDGARPDWGAYLQLDDPGARDVVDGRVPVAGHRVARERVGVAVQDVARAGGGRPSRAGPRSRCAPGPPGRR